MQSTASCMRCSKYLLCRDKKKGPSHRCQDFRQLKDLDSVADAELFPLLPKGENASPIDYDALPASKRLNNTLDKAEKSDDASEGRKRKRILTAADVDDDEEGLDNFIWKAMRDAYDPHTNSVRDLKVDDRDLKLATNYLDFCGNVAGKAIKLPFARQLWIATMLLGEFCPRCTKPKWLDVNNVPVDMDPLDLAKRLALTENGICPYCNASRAEMILEGDLQDLNQLVLVFGQRAGKSAFTSTVAGYHKHRMLKAPRMSTICRGIQDFTPLTGTFVGITAARAIKLLWNPFTEIVKHSQWFDDYFEMLRHYGNHYGKEFYKEGGLFYRYFHKNLDYYPMGPQKRTLRGDTRIFAAVDELGWFPYNIVSSDNPEDDEEDEREHANGDEVYEALDKSLLTVRTEVLNLYKKNISTIPTGLGLYISSPKSERDKISRLLKESQDPAAMALGLRLPTWEVNPLYTRDHPIIVSAYAKNAAKAERDYGANPPKLDEGIFKKEQILPLFRTDIINSHRIVYDFSRPDRTLGKIIEAVMATSTWEPRILTLDAGLTNNAFAMAAGHREGSRLRVDTLIEVVPAKGTKIDFPGTYREIILPLVKSTNIGLVGADRWNSINLMQQLEDDTDGKVQGKQFTLNGNHLNKVVTGIATHDILLPGLELPPDQILGVRDFKRELRDFPASHLFLQLCTIREQRGTLTKGEGFTDDLFRALALLYTLTFSPKIKEHMDKMKPLGSTKTEGVTRSAVFVAGRSGGGYI